MPHIKNPVLLMRMKREREFTLDFVVGTGTMTVCPQRNQF
jgi:hypothetical protein